MKTIYHAADSRGTTDLGWLISRHTFSFGQYVDQERIRFGLLRVLNDDDVLPGRGFDTHPHENMEIVTLPLRGALEHRDSTGTHGVIRPGDVQIMSAGKGIRHSEYNHSQDEGVQFLQIWVFPKLKNIAPRYAQASYDTELVSQRILTLISPDGTDDSVFINQDAWFSMYFPSEETTETYRMRLQGNGLYIFVIEGDAEVAGQALARRDGMGVWDTDEFQYRAAGGSRLLFMEVPMAL